MKASKRRFRQIDGLLEEIAAMWGDEDEYFSREMDSLRDHVKESAENCLAGHAELLRERAADADHEGT